MQIVSRWISLLCFCFCFISMFNAYMLFLNTVSFWKRDLNLECESLCQPEYLWIFVNSNCKTAAAWKKRKKKECIYRLCTPTPQWPGCKYGSFALFTQCIPLWTVWQWCVTNAGNVSDMFLSQLYNMHVNTFISQRLHLTSCVCVFVCAITQENICQTAAVSHPQLKHTQWSCSHVSSMQNKLHYQQHHDEASAFSDVQTQKMSGSPLSQNTDSGLFPARCADLRSQNKREPCLGKEEEKKNCITKTMISVILHAYLSENQNPLQFIILRVSEDVGLCAGALLYICACLCWWLFMHIQAFM